MEVMMKIGGALEVVLRRTKLIEVRDQRRWCIVFD